MNYIASKGISHIMIQNNNNQPKVNDVNWNMEYNGDKAKYNIFINDDGKQKQLTGTLDNNDLAEMLNIPSEPDTLEKRFVFDFPEGQRTLTSLKLPIQKFRKTKRRSSRKRSRINSSRSRRSRSKSSRRNSSSQ